MKTRLLWAVLVFLLPAASRAGFTETLPKGTFLLDESISMSNMTQRFNNQGELGPYMDPIKRYEPGGGLQGTIYPDVSVNFTLLINQLQYGLLDNLTLAIGIPVSLSSEVRLDLGWEPGDYQPVLGRPYSSDDFWEWAQSMGQPKPVSYWKGNQGVLSDIILGARYRFSDGWEWFEQNGLALAILMFGTLPTGKHPDTEEVVSMGTNAWDLKAQGELGFHLSADKFFERSLDGRLTLGVDVFYEACLPHEYKTPRGTKHPLLLNYQPYVGDSYTIRMGDFAGFSLQADVVPWRGLAWQTWLTKDDPAKADRLPPLVTLTFRYTFTHLGQSEYYSDSELWNWQQHKVWRPGYRNQLFARLTVSLLRLGVPVQLYVAYRNLTWLPGKNAIAADVLFTGIQVPAAFW